jgi:peptidoglycan hydrolase-like protein with peptidoglycan-binding domain
MGAATAVGAALFTSVLPIGAASADPSPSAWAALRNCESGGNYAINTGNGYYGAYQFSIGTWAGVGGSGLPSAASPGEQDARALILYRERGWQPWTCASILGLKSDKDAGSGRIGDIKVPTGKAKPPTSTPPKSTVPAFPSKSVYKLGSHNAAIATFQKQMRTRGSAVKDKGLFDQKTKAVVIRIQTINGLPETGVLNASTWKMAWTGSYTMQRLAQIAPAWPGTQYWSPGEKSATIARWQRQLKTRGSAVNTTGTFDRVTLAAVKRIQRLNGLPETGLIGPTTWALAWSGTY